MKKQNPLFEKTIKLLYATTFDARYEELLEHMGILTFLQNNNITTKRHYYKLVLEDHIEDALGKYDYDYKDAMDFVKKSHGYDDIQSVVDFEWEPVQELLGDNFNRVDVDNKLTQVLDEIDNY